MKIVLGFDESAHAVAALRWIVRTQKPADTHVTIVSAVHVPVTAHAEAHMTTMPYPTERIEEVTRQHEELCQRAEATLKQAGFATSWKVLPGDPREALVESARNEQADLLVVGSHGRSALLKLLLGSVALHVVSHAPCDVLVVKRTS